MDIAKITIWDDDAERIAQADRHIRAACRELGLSAVIDSQSEPPLLARMNLTGKTPAFEINGLYWKIRTGAVPSVESCIRLLRRLLEGRQDF